MHAVRRNLEEDFQVRVGILRLRERVPADRVFVTKPRDRTLHPHYNMLFLDNDIALIKLPASVTFSQSK